MTYTILYTPEPLWEGTTENQNQRYTLHRALILLPEGLEVTGYALRCQLKNGGDIAEAYADGEVEVGNGLYGDWIQDCRPTNRQLPPHDPRDVERFANEFAALCEREGTPLLESEP